MSTNCDTRDCVCTHSFHQCAQFKKNITPKPNFLWTKMLILYLEPLYFPTYKIYHAYVYVICMNMCTYPQESILAALWPPLSALEYPLIKLKWFLWNVVYWSTWSISREWSTSLANYTIYKNKNSINLMRQGRLTTP